MFSLLPCSRCNLYGHDHTSSACGGLRRCCPRCGSMNHDGRTSALCPDPVWLAQVTIVRPIVIHTPVATSFTFPELIPPAQMPVSAGACI